jgi:hypothetical protein
VTEAVHYALIKQNVIACDEIRDAVVIGIAGCNSAGLRGDGG